MKKRFVLGVYCQLIQDSSNLFEKICMAWVQMRKYETCVVCMSILLRICLAGAPTPCKLFE